MNDSMMRGIQVLLQRAPVEFWQVMGGILVLLVVASAIAAVLKRRSPARRWTISWRGSTPGG
ncbi:MAG: hypothetical protein AB7D30_08870 [Lysobacteraceae bacterium]